MNFTKTELDWLVNLIPNSEPNIKRLYQLVNVPDEAKIATFGKYNHGKSTLLNALCGDDIFKAADKRETTIIQEHSHNGVVWVDTPGLDADTHNEDDKKAIDAAFEIADFIFLVHNVKAGELDKYEMDVYRKLMHQDNNYSKKLFLVLTQIDQLVSEDDTQRVIDTIKKQLPQMEIFPVSSVRYIRGIKENKDKFVELSGMDNLLNHIQTLKSPLQLLRKQEIKRLKRKANLELDDLISSEKKKLTSLPHEVEESHSEFKKLIFQSQQKIAEYAEQLGI